MRRKSFLRKRQAVAPLLLTGAILAAGCGAGTSKTPADTETAEKTAAAEPAEAGKTEIETAGILDASELFTDEDKEIGYDETTAVRINLNDCAAGGNATDDASANGSAANSDSAGSAANSDSAGSGTPNVSADGKIITISAAGTYILSGTLEDGMIRIDAGDSDEIRLVLDGADITCSSSAAIYVRKAKKVYITTASGTDNTLSSGETYEAIDDNKIDAAIFSKSDLTLNGSGSLTIHAPAGHGVVSKDDLILTSGTYAITAASHGLSGKDSIRIAGGDYAIEAGKDGIHAENNDDESLGFLYIGGGTFRITAEGDGISAGTILQTDGGDFTIEAGGGSANAAVREPAGQHGFRGFGRQGKLPESGMTPPEGDTTPPEGSTTPPEDGMTPPGNDMTPPRDDMVPPEADREEGADTAPPTFPESETETRGDSAAPDGAGQSSEISGDSQEESSVSTKGLKAGTFLLVNGGSFSIDSADDALHSNGDLTISGGSFEISAGDDGIHADNAVLISEGVLSISRSYEGIEGLSIDITGGTISLTASDDGLNAAGGSDSSGLNAAGGSDSSGLNAAGGSDSSGLGGRGGDLFAATEGAYIRISGGSLQIDASGDGIDSNGDLYVDGGETYVSGPTGSGDSALDYNGEASISGGIFAAAGSSGMAQNFGSASKQGVMMVMIDSADAGTVVSLSDSNGQEILSWQPDKAYSCVILSCPEITEGASYTLSAGSYTTLISMDSLAYGSSNEKGGRQRPESGENSGEGERPAGRFGGGRPEGRFGTGGKDGTSEAQ